MLKKYSISALLISFVFLSGCESLPPGDAPKGHIVEIHNNNDDILDENAAVEKMVTAIACSEPLITSDTQINVILAKTNAPSEYSAQTTSLSAKVFGKLVSTGIVNFSTNDTPDFFLTSTFVKQHTVNDGEIIFRWIMGLTKEGSSQSVFSYTLKVKVKLNTSSINLIKSEEITPTYK